MPLTDTQCRNLKPAEKPRKVSDGHGLYMQIEPSGSKLWRLAYRYGGKQKLLSLGRYPTVSLKAARMACDAARELLSDGTDPSEVRKAEKAKGKREAVNTFEAIAVEWFAHRKDGWVPTYSKRVWSRLIADVFPAIGQRTIGEIEPPELLAVIRRIESRGAVVLAGRILQVCGRIFRYAIATGRATRDPSQDLRGALKSPGPRERRAALKASELPAFLKALEAYRGDRSTALAIKLTMHTMLRTQEVRFGRWAEIEGLDGPMPLWRIPAERMKMRSEHLVPLSPQAVGILRELKSRAGESEFILPAPTIEGVISQNTMIYGLYRMGYHSRATIHGFRGTASTILNEAGFNRDWIERQLAHTERNDVRAAYNSAEWLPQRREMLQWWSGVLSGCRSLIA